MKFILNHIKSYQYALQGLWLAFYYEPNMRVHSLAAVVVVLLNTVLDISRTDWALTLLMVGVVFAGEIFNTAIEKLADRVTTDRDPLIGKVKDLAAGAVLMLSLAAAIAGAIIYLPYVLYYIGS